MKGATVYAADLTDLTDLSISQTIPIQMCVYEWTMNATTFWTTQQRTDIDVCSYAQRNHDCSVIVDPLMLFACLRMPPLATHIATHVRHVSVWKNAWWAYDRLLLLRIHRRLVYERMPIVEHIWLAIVADEERRRRRMHEDNAGRGV